MELALQQALINHVSSNSAQFIMILVFVNGLPCHSLIYIVVSHNFIKPSCRPSSSHSENDKKTEQAVVIRDIFQDAEDKDKNTYLAMIQIFVQRDVHRRGHVEFIYSAMKHMEEFHVHKDLEAYKSLIDILPKGKFIPTNIFQAEFMHYPKQQQCIIDVLEMMEDNGKLYFNGVMPDREMETMLLNIFGNKGHPLRKYWRMMYWMPKFKNLSPWPLPNPVPNDSLELAKLGIQRITSVDLQTTVVTYQTADLEDSLEDTWIVSGQSPKQKELLGSHQRNMPVYIEGPFRLWLRNLSINYFIMRADPKPRPRSAYDPDDVTSLKIPFFSEPKERKEVAAVRSVHEQDEGTILAVCATGTSSRDSLLSWVRLQEGDGNPALSEVPVLFKLRSPAGDVVPENSDKTDSTSDDKPNS
ncbi:hypothetical protein PR048_002613 [Dryococelus australis]|uniref:Evolutionarily conserved signaling intermediate in Toll pathway, mitochondrial n=1 Tax=Dryococelus australis TaxID=614101 RepID=A0ABQ9IKT2_9NEOP|nr:hypothetical protein PR048_002613 [Dryococelus australis]